MNSDERVIGRLRVTHQTVRLCLLLLPVWTFGAGELARFAWSNARPGVTERSGLIKGGDFVQFYVAGSLAREQRWAELYAPDALEQAVAAVLPAAAGQVPAPVYAPHVAILFAPLSRLAYVHARWWWLGLSIIIYLAAAALTIHRIAPFERYAGLAWLTVLLNPAFVMVLVTGQTGALGALCWAATALALAVGNRWAAGAVLGVLLFKPSLLVGAVPILIVRREWTMLAGLSFSGFLQIVASIPLVGAAAWGAYAQSIAAIRANFFLTDTVPHQKQSIAGFYQLLTGSGSTAIVLAGATALLVVLLWWRHRERPWSSVSVSMLVLTAVLLSPHLYVYDLVVLTPALLMIASRLAHPLQPQDIPAVAWTGYAVLFAPLSGGFAMHTRIQLSTLALLGLFVALHRLHLRGPAIRSNQDWSRPTLRVPADWSAF